MTYALPALFAMGCGLILIGWVGQERSAAYCGVIGAMCIGAGTLWLIGLGIWRLVS